MKMKNCHMGSIAVLRLTSANILDKYAVPLSCIIVIPSKACLRQSCLQICNEQPHCSFAALDTAWS